jgi:hypothetical protein
MSGSSIDAGLGDVGLTSITFIVHAGAAVMLGVSGPPFTMYNVGFLVGNGGTARTLPLVGASEPGGLPLRKTGSGVGSPSGYLDGSKGKCTRCIVWYWN